MFFEGYHRGGGRVRLRACLLLIVSCAWSILTVVSLHHAAKHHDSSTTTMLFTQEVVTQHAHSKHTGPHGNFVKSLAALFAACSTLAALTYQGCFLVLPPF